MTQPNRFGIERAVVAALSISALALGGCSKFDSVKLDAVTQPPFPAAVSSSSIQVVEGTAVAVFLRPFRGSRALDPDDVRIEVNGDRVSAIPVSTTPAGADYNGTWIITGLGAGKSELVVTLDLHDGEVRIPVTVNPQPVAAP